MPPSSSFIPASMASAIEPIVVYRPSSSTLRTPALPLDSRPPEPKKQPPREDKFIMSYGSKLHSYGRDKAPYPMSYNRVDLELGVMDCQVVKHVKEGSCSFLKFKKNDQPKRCLDVGTGLGAWVIDAAKQWPECTFVGYDLVNVQIPLSVLPPSIAERITWVHGNFLRTRFPFEDEEFDHVHLSGVAFAVPENKWMSMYEEIRRVMRTGGTIEQLEEDAIFPVLPRWFTEPLHAHSRGPYMHRPDGTQQSSPPSPAPLDHPHEHALLESLFNDVFENRFINPTPSSTLPSYFSACFGHLYMPPPLTYPMPPLAPFAPLPAEITPHPQAIEANRKPEGATPLPPDLGSDVNLSIPTTSTSTLQSTSSDSRSFDSSRQKIGNASDLPSPHPSFERSSSAASTNNSSSRTSSGSSREVERGPPVPSADLCKDSTSTGAAGLLPIDKILALDEHSLNMQLLRALGLVMSAKEAMWEELVIRVQRNDESLREFGWEEGDYSVGPSRAKFDALMEQYRSDVRARVSLWHSMVLNGWEYPRRDPISRAEMLEEERLREDILEARRNANVIEEDSHPFSRSTRLLVGAKVRMELLS